MKKRGLGRNLDALLSRSTPLTPKPVAFPVASPPTEENHQLRILPIEWLQRGRYQPRQEMAAAALQELADSIQAQGIIQPILVRPLATDSYEIIAGERRWRAAQLAGLNEVPVVIKTIPDEAALVMALIENIQRENLNPLEEATALQRLIDEFAMTHQQVATAVGKSRTAVSNLLRLLSLTPAVKKMLEAGQLEMGHARALLALTDNEQVQAAQQVIKQNLSVRQTEQLVSKWAAAQKKRQMQPVTKNVAPDIERLQQRLSDQLGAAVNLQHHTKGHGKVVIHYHNLDELEGILAHIK